MYLIYRLNSYKNVYIYCPGILGVRKENNTRVNKLNFIYAVDSIPSLPFLYQ